MTLKVAGVDPGQRQLNGPQTTGRTYRELSVPEFATTCDEDTAVVVRDGTTLLADVHRPDSDRRFPALIAASPYPRQIQDLGAPMGFIEAGATDFWVPRGYVHVIANLRGTSGSGGTFGFFDAQERRDLHDLVEWSAAQPWCNGKVGMIGISYFAMAQLEAAVEQPPHLEAIFPVAVTTDLYEAAVHHGLFCSSFVTPFLAMVGITNQRSDAFWRGRLIDTARRVLTTPYLHAKFATMNGESSIRVLQEMLKLHHDPHPWDDLWRATAVEHPLHDDWWAARDLTPLLDRIDVPAYLGCDWQNVPLHLPSTFRAFHGMTNSPEVRVAMLGEFGLTWPWESLHVEALAWFDHWLKGRDTGILDGEPIRYFVPGADEWRTTPTWPLPGATHRSFELRTDGTLASSEDSTDPPDGGGRQLLVLGSGLDRPRPSDTDPPGWLEWTSKPLPTDLDIVGPSELVLDATTTAIDTAWIVTIQEVDANGHADHITAGYLRASLREVDRDASRPGAPVVPCLRAEAVPVGEAVRYRIPIVDTARRVPAGHSLRVVLTSDDQDNQTPAIMGFRHATVGTSSLNRIEPTSHLLLPVVAP